MMTLCVRNVSGNRLRIVGGPFVGSFVNLLGKVSHSDHLVLVCVGLKGPKASRLPDRMFGRAQHNLTFLMELV